jgi:hypothetical protein
MRGTGISERHQVGFAGSWKDSGNRVTKEAKLEAIARLLMNYEHGMTIAEYANKILSAVENESTNKRFAKGASRTTAQSNLRG